MAQAPRKPNTGPARPDDGMKGLLDLFSRNPTPARVTMHVERLLAGWRDALDPDAYAERLDTLRESHPDRPRTLVGAGDHPRLQVRHISIARRDTQEPRRITTRAIAKPIGTSATL